MMRTVFPPTRPVPRGLALLALVAVFAVPFLRADDAAQPARAVRLSTVDGQVTLSENGQVLANPALINTPVFEGAQLTTGSDGRAEIQFDDGSVARVSPDGALSIPVLQTGGNAELRLDRGLGYFELQGAAGAGAVLVRFGDATLTASGLTVIRIRMDTPPGEVAIFSGNAHLDRTGGLALDLHGGESVRLDPADASRYTLTESIEPDSWDTWNSDRDQALTSEAAQRTGAASDLVNSDAPAWNDLDTYGNWYDVPGSGYVWSPYESRDQGWDPWGNGYWMWTPRFGYIWVSGDAWGYMPFACGRWSFFDDFGWGWMPAGCSPWWGGGYWVSTYYDGPGWYVYPHRPDWRDRRMHPGGGGRVIHPVVPIHRRPPGGTRPRPVQARNGPVTIGGVRAVPLHPMPQRAMYGPMEGATPPHRQPAWGAARPPLVSGVYPVARPNPTQQSPPQQGMTPGGGRTPYQPAPRGLSPIASRPTPGSQGTPRQMQPGAPQNAQPSRPSPVQHSAPAPTPHSSPAPAPAHATSGGGGGGGGSSHASSTTSGHK